MMHLSSSQFHAGLAGMLTREHRFQVPLDYHQPQGRQLEIFAREVVARRNQGLTLPWVVYFQGGPGFGSPRPVAVEGWLGRLLEDCRVLLLDQRGTGRSTPVSVCQLQTIGSAGEQGQYLTHFRADNIVRDAEVVRRLLVGENQRWLALGQSFGGWCLANYLSQAPHGLAGALFTGGLPPIGHTAEEVYEMTSQVVRRKNERFYQRFGEDEEIIQQILAVVQKDEVRLPSGDRLTPERFQQLGLLLYRSQGAEALHYLLETALERVAGELRLSPTFLSQIEQGLPFNTQPIFSLLHEAIYTEGPATRWAADRVLQQLPEFQPTTGQRLLFTGEMIFPWMFEQYYGLAPLRDVAHWLASYEGWAPLYNVEALRENAVPCAAVVYYEDMCVVRQFSEQAAGMIGNMRTWITNEYEHNGLSVDGDRIVGRLLDMIHGDIIFSY